MVQVQAKLRESVKTKGEFECKECGRKVENKKFLSEHIREMHPKMHHCVNCEETFQESWRLELHM